MPSTWSISPKIVLLSHQMIGDTIDISAKSTIHLRCNGQKKIHWTFPNNRVSIVSSQEDHSQKDSIKTKIIKFS